MKQSPLKVIIAGFGHQSQIEHLPVIEAHPLLQLVGIIDPLYSDNYKNLPVFKDFHKLDLSGLSYDLVVVSPPHHLHYEITRQALERGKHVLKEKPAAVNIKELTSLSQISKKNKVHLLVNTQRRLISHHSIIKKEILPLIGDPFLIEGKYTIHVPNPEENWRGQLNLAGGGCILDMGYHLIDLLTYYFGLPNQIMALSSHQAIAHANYSAEDTAAILFTYNSSVNINGTLLISRFCGPKDECLKIIGSQGILQICKNKAILTTNAGKKIKVIKPSRIEHPINHFADVVLSKKKNLLNIDSHFANMKFIKACYQSMKTHKSVKPKIN